MEVELVGKRYLSEVLNLSVGSINSYINKHRRLLPPNAVKVSGRWRWPKSDVDAFARLKNRSASDIDLPTLDEFGTESISDDYLLNIEQCAAYLGFTAKSVQWRATNRNAPRPLPSVLVIVPDRKRPRRYFKKADLDIWKQAGAQSSESTWPPSRRLLLALSAPPEPDPRQFPDGSDIPSYVNLAGRTVRPAWLECMCGCGARFLSPDRSHVRFAQDCKHKLNAARFSIS